MKVRTRNHPPCTLFLCITLLATLLLALSACGRTADKPLELTGVFPADGGERVPANTAVELTFSAPPEKLDDFFTVDPPMEGTFHYMGDTVAFVPAWSWRGWEYDTTYTVTLKAGLGAEDGKGKLAEDHSFSFTICKEDDNGYQLYHNWETFLPRDLPVIDLRLNGWGSRVISEEEQYAVSVFRLESGEQYLRELYRAAALPGGVRVDTSGLAEVMTFTQEAAGLLDERAFDLDIVFPEALETGWYVATVTPSEGALPVQKLLQIQESAVYTQLGQEEAVLWYNSTETGGPVEKPTLTVYQDVCRTMTPAITVEGDESGVAVLDLGRIDPEDPAWTGVEPPENEEDYQMMAPRLPIALSGQNGTVYYDVLDPYSFGTELSLRQEYYGFLYLDRPIYHRDDTVKFWGVARPRKDAAALSQVQVAFFHNWGDDPLERKTVDVSPDGTFTGEFTYSGLASGSLYLRVYPAGQEDLTDLWNTIASETADIAQYKKPIYTASVTTDKLYYQAGEQVKAQVEVSLFDRTPAAGMTMILTADGYEDWEEDWTLRTDDKGLIQAPFFTAAVESNGRGWYPLPFSLGARNGDASDVDLTVRETVYVFPTTNMLEAEELRTGDRSDVRVTASAIDFAKVPGGRQIIQDYGTLRGAPVQIPVTGRLVKVSYDRTELPPYYDRYTKKSIPRYQYTRTETEEMTFTRRTGADGTLLLEDILPPEEELTYYYLELTAYDGGYQTLRLTLGDPWVCNPEDREGKFHTFQVRTTLNDESRSYWGATFAYGEEAAYQVMENGVPLETGTVMTNLLQHGLVEAPKTGGPAGTIPCTEEKLPNFTFCGAYFDGTRIYPIKPFSMDVDPESRALSLQILPEREDYRPGETAEVTLRLTDENGRAVPDTSVCLGVVDEAVFAVEEQYLQMGYDLYQSVFYNYPEVRASYVQHGCELYYGEGGKGGGGGNGGLTIRETFKDTAAFLPARTGADGTARLSVQLPENLTQWRLTAVALDSRAWWGYNKSALYTSLPFRIDPILSTTFLSGDTIACTVRGFGTGIQTTDPITYTASIQGYGEELTTEAEALAGDITPLTFRKLPAGEYTMTVTAACGEYRDGVRVPFTVRDSALLFPVHETVKVADGLESIRPALYPVDISVYHEGQRPFMESWDLLCRDTSGRGDALLAKAAVAPVMTAWFGEGYTHPETDLSDVQVVWDENLGENETAGGIRLYPYAKADPATSARAAVAAPELAGRGDLGSYLHSVFDSSQDREEQAAVLMGLAALDSLSDEQEVILRGRAKDGSLPIRESEYLIAGLSYLEPTDAQKYYAQIIAPKLQAERSGVCIPGETPYGTIDNTAGALACAILTGAADDAENIIHYLAENSHTRYGTMRGPCQLEAALYLKRFQLKEAQPPTVSYTLDGERKTETLAWNSCLSLSLTEAQWKALDLRAEGGTPALASLWYTGTPEDLGLENSSRITVTKTMDTPEDQKHLGGETTVTIKVELDSSLPYGSYRLVEWVPSNMRLRGVVENDKKPFSYTSEEQLLTVDFLHSPQVPGSRVFTFQYTATSVLDTECTLERSYAYNPETMECGRTEKGEFLPSDYYYLGVGYLFRKPE